MNIDKLLKSPGFCALPFTHVCVFPNGDAVPCCISKRDFNFGNTNKQSFKEIYSTSNEKLIEFRRKFINSDSLPDTCEACKGTFSSSSDSYRETSNLILADHLKSLNFQTEEELINNQSYAYFDVRVSNLCNLRCVYCNHGESSRIAEELVKQGNDVTVLINSIKENKLDYLAMILDNLPHITKMYFCGGEPLLLKEHYEILDLLIKLGYSKNIQLSYNTNLMQLGLKDQNILDYWKHFKDILVAASIDATDSQLSYIRDSSDWEVIYDNLTKIKKSDLNIRIVLTPVLTVLNVFYLPSLIEIVLKDDLIEENDINILSVQGREYLKPSVLPDHIKKQVLELYKGYKVYDFISEQLFAEPSSNEQMQILKSVLASNDQLRNKNFAEVFPELIDIFKDIS